VNLLVFFSQGFIRLCSFPCLGFFGVKKNLVGGFNPFEKYWSKWESSPNRDENKKETTT